MKGMVWALAFGVAVAGGGAHAQQQVFIQIEAQPSLTRVEERLRDYASYLPAVNGFAMGSGWYGIALGPYGPGEARARLRALLNAGQIPRDSFIETPGDYGRQVWPRGGSDETDALAAALARGAEGTGGAGEIESRDLPPAGASEQTAAPQSAAPQPEPPQPDETPREARASERQLSREDRADLQVALAWAGHYAGAIDAAFGPGTRNAMAGWQEANGADVTGVLTTRQRALLLQQYNAVLDGMDLAQVTDSRAGIAIDMPTGAVARDRYESPFAHYEGTGAVEGAKVLLISEPGDRDTLNGLYEIMQTLEIVPRDGERELRRNGFTLQGQGARIVSHTEARLVDGAIKGFTLVWPAGDEDRRSRILAAMQDSFAPLPGVLDRQAVSDAGQAVDLVAGLRVRQPMRAASGFFVDDRGHVLTAAAQVAGCGEITLDDGLTAQIVAQDAELGAAILAPDARLAPRAVAEFRTDAPRRRSDVAVAGYSYGGVLPSPTLSYGTLEDLADLSGSDTRKRLEMEVGDGDAGGPVLDSGGAVLGLLLPRSDSGRQLPQSVQFSARSDALLPLLREAGVRIRETQGLTSMAPEDLTALAGEFTVLVSCWE